MLFFAAARNSKVFRSLDNLKVMVLLSFDNNGLNWRYVDWSLLWSGLAKNGKVNEQNSR